MSWIPFRQSEWYFARDFNFHVHIYHCLPLLGVTPPFDVPVQTILTPKMNIAIQNVLNTIYQKDWDNTWY